MSGCCGGPAPVGRSGGATAWQVPAAGAATSVAGLVALPGGEFWMGGDLSEGYPEDGEGPRRLVTVSPYAISATAVSNAEFRDFVRATQYVTEAEQIGRSFVFWLQVGEDTRRSVRAVPRGLPWWLPIEYACWQRPEGAGSSIDDRLDHPVVHVSWHDAQAYCAWAQRRLPTEAEWEYAARGGLDRRRHAWGDDDDQGTGLQARCNTWRGAFPARPAEGWQPGPVDVRALPPNGHGLHHMTGNVWQWCADWFSPGYHAETPAVDPCQQRVTGRRSMRGGSFLCHASYCHRYRVAGRSGNAPGSTSSNVGFRVAG